jgi:nitrogenase subunit NifH
MYTIAGIKVDGQMIGKGIYEMMPDEDKALVAAGDISKAWTNTVEKLVRDKIGRIYAEKLGHRDSEDLVGKLAAAVKKEFVSKIMREIISGIHGAARMPVRKAVSA